MSDKIDVKKLKGEVIGFKTGSDGEWNGFIAMHRDTSFKVAA